MIKERGAVGVLKLLIFLIATNAHASTVTWEPSTTYVDGSPLVNPDYRVYCAPINGKYINVGTTKQTSLKITDCAVPEQIIVRAVDQYGTESKDSNMKIFGKTNPDSPVLTCGIGIWVVDPQYSTRPIYDPILWSTKKEIGRVPANTLCGDWIADYSNQTSRSYRLVTYAGITGIVVCKSVN